MVTELLIQDPVTYAFLLESTIPPLDMWVSTFIVSEINFGF
jgi:hypothetical protein